MKLGLFSSAFSTRHWAVKCLVQVLQLGGWVRIWTQAGWPQGPRPWVPGSRDHHRWDPCPHRRGENRQGHKQHYFQYWWVLWQKLKQGKGTEWQREGEALCDRWKLSESLSGNGNWAMGRSGRAYSRQRVQRLWDGNKLGTYWGREEDKWHSVRETEPGRTSQGLLISSSGCYEALKGFEQGCNLLWFSL